MEVEDSFDIGVSQDPESFENTHLPISLMAVS